MKITQKMLREVKKHDRQTFYDEAWWTVQKRPETAALQVAIHFAKDGDSAADIVASAQRYMDRQNNINDHGTVEHKNQTLLLTQDAYPTGGSFRVPGGATYTGDWYEAHAVDAGGNDYRVIWTDVDYNTGYESDACDWDNPNYVLEA